MNFALAHVLGASIEIFDAVVLILAILVVGGFLRDGKSNYLEGTLCVMVYMIIAISAYFYPNPDHAGGNAGEEGGH
jgi:Ca2+:H+ antiporter